MSQNKALLILLILLLSNFLIFGLVVPSKQSNNNELNSYKSFSKNILLSTSDSKYPQHVEPTLAIGQNNQLYVGWKNANYPNSGGLAVSFTTSNDNGSTWSNPIFMPSNISNTLFQSDPWLNVHDNEIYYSYLDYSNFSSLNQISQVTMAKSIDNGSTWTTSKASDNNYFADKETFIVSPNGTIYLTYDNINVQTGLGSVKLSRSINNAVTFNDISRVNSLAFENILAPYPALSSNGTLFVAWLKLNSNTNDNGDVYYAYSTDGGIKFSPEKDLNPETNFGASIVYNYAPGISTMPVIKFDSKDRLYILWTEHDKVWQVYLRYSDDFGIHWSKKIPVNAYTDKNQWEPDMAIDSKDNLHVVWYEETYNRYRPYYREISFTGENRSTIIQSSVIPVASSFTSSDFTRPGDYCTIRVDSFDLPHVVWTDGRHGQFDIYYAHASSDYPASSIPGFNLPLLVLPIAFYILLRKRKNF